MTSTRITVLCGLVLLAFTLTASPTVPPLISYQGRLTDNSGAPVDTTADITVTIFDDQAGTLSLWSETHSNVTVEGGLFDLILGDVTPIPASVINGEVLWLGLEVDGGAMSTPLTPIISSPYAIRARTADTADFALTSAGDGGWSDDGAVVRLESSGDEVGIGTSDPDAKLHVAGAIRVGSGSRDFEMFEALTTDPEGWSSFINYDGIAIGSMDGGNRQAMIIADGSNQHNIFSIVTSRDGGSTWNAPLIVEQDGDVGIGVMDPSASLEVNGEVVATSFTGDGSGLTNISSTAWTLDGDNVYRETGNVGIGTTSPEAKLHTKWLQHEARLSEGSGVEGEYHSSNDTAIGQLGTIGAGVRGTNTRNTTTAAGVLGKARSDLATGVIGEHEPTGNQGELGGQDFGVSSDGDLVVEDGAFRGNIGPNNGAPFPRPAYNSGYVAIGQGVTITLHHDIGGSPGDYLVDIHARTAGHNRQIRPRDIDHDGLSSDVLGIEWSMLTDSTIQVYRFTDDQMQPEFRIRIWVIN